MRRSVRSRLFLPWCSFVVLSVFLAGCGKSPRHTTWALATGAGEHERLMWQSMQKKDWKDVEYHLAPTFVGVTAGGQALDRSAWLEYWQQQQPGEALLSEIQVHPEGPDMVVTFVLRLSKEKAGSGGQPATFRVISNWQQVKRGWILTATSITPILSN